jgi:putative hemolysin
LDPEPSLLSTIDYNLLFGSLAIFALLCCSAMVSAAEVAFFSLTPDDLNRCAQKSPQKFQTISTLLKRPKKLLATLVVANNFINIGIIILYSVIGFAIIPPVNSVVLQFIIDVFIVTVLILSFGEVLPKIYASRNNVKFASFFASPLYFLDKLLTPVSIPLRRLINFLHKKLGKQKSSFSVDQLSQALGLTSSEGTSRNEQKILQGIVSFGNTDTRQVMSPRIDIFALDIESTFTEVLPKITEKGFSRIPVYRENIDQIEGVLFVKDLIPHIHKKEFDWKTLVREPFFVPENKKLDNLLKDFQAMKSHLAIVVDEYGGTSGLVSLEDVIEEIVGDISDEFDDENINYSQIDDKNFLFEGKINMKDFCKIIDADEELFEESKGEAETLAGFILELLGNFPKKGQKINFDNYRFTIETVDKKRIKQIKLTIE